MSNLCVSANRDSTTARFACPEEPFRSLASGEMRPPTPTHISDLSSREPTIPLGYTITLSVDASPLDRASIVGRSSRDIDPQEKGPPPPSRSLRRRAWLARRLGPRQSSVLTADYGRLADISVDFSRN